MQSVLRNMPLVAAPPRQRAQTKVETVLETARIDREKRNRQCCCQLKRLAKQFKAVLVPLGDEVD
ncbi:hypothetical protein IWQ48_001126 [Labrenzia sp. EL_13]|nr:hypothetical protein [Labrenzia sp. EL_162]MBG6193626.1 hypothetical protein [Labrenzia sp. EL_159]MBG6200008.1 hypothetical protein [Labrenzia sp. EL_13]